MEMRCDCPKPLNILIGVFLIFIAILAIFKIWQTAMPVWTILLCLIFGLLSLILNTISKARHSGDLTIEQANKLHSRDGY